MKKIVQGLLVSLFCIVQAQSSEMSILAVKAPHRLLMDIQQIDSNRLIAVGERGHLLISEDSGSHWRQVLVPTQALLTRVMFIDQQIGWAIGHQQVILKTEDGGNSWALQYQNLDLDQPGLFDIWFKNANYGIAVGAYGLYLKTEDGGKNWVPVFQENLASPDTGFTHFYSIAYDNQTSQLFMAGELGFLAVSNDFGESWTPLESPYGGSFFNIRSLSDGSLIVMGLRGHLFRSEDKGQNWHAIETNIHSVLQKSVVLPDNRILIVGADGTQLVSSDFAKTVKLQQRSDRVHLSSALALSDQNVLLVGANGVIKSTLLP